MHFGQSLKVIFSHAYIPNHQVRNMHVHGLKKESVQSKDVLSKEIFPGIYTGDQIAYYFVSPRPPEKAVR
jgi:hypothetical protein